MKKLALLLALTTAIPAQAGGPVIVEDITTEAAAERDRVNPLLIIGGLIILGALIASGGGDDAAPADPGPKPCAFNGDGC